MYVNIVSTHSDENLPNRNSQAGVTVVKKNSSINAMVLKVYIYTQIELCIVYTTVHVLRFEFMFRYLGIGLYILVNF